MERKKFEVTGSVHLSAANLPLLIDGNLVILKKEEFDRMRDSADEWKCRYTKLQSQMMGKNVLKYIKKSVVFITRLFDLFTATRASEAEKAGSSDAIDGRVAIQDGAVEPPPSQQVGHEPKKSPIGKSQSKVQRPESTFRMFDSRDRLKELFTLEIMEKFHGQEQKRERLYTAAEKRNLLRVALGLSESLAEWFSISFWRKNKVVQEVSKTTLGQAGILG